MSWFFGWAPHGISVTQWGTEPSAPALEDDLLTTGSPGKSQSVTDTNKYYSHL